MSESGNYLNEEAIPSIEELLTENVEQAELIQKLLSEKSELQRIVQEQKLTLQELKEKIVTLNNSDLQLKKAEQILRESKQKLAEAVSLKKATIEEDRSRKQFYEKSQRECSLKESIAVKREKGAQYIIDNQNKVLNEKAKQMTASVRTSLEQQHQKREKALCRAYESKENQLHAITIGGLLYSFYVTVLTLMTTVRFKSDLMAVIEEVCSIAMTIWKNLLIGANTASKICNKIPNGVVAMILSWVVQAVVILLVLAVIMGGIGWGIYKIFQIYQSHFADRCSVVVSLISFSLLIWFGDYIGEIIQWNLVGVFLIVQVAYIGVRMYAESRYMVSAKYSYAIDKISLAPKIDASILLYFSFDS